MLTRMVDRRQRPSDMVYREPDKGQRFVDKRYRCRDKTEWDEVDLIHPIGVAAVLRTTVIGVPVLVGQ